MELIQNQTFDQERAFYGVQNIQVQDCAFDGPADGESAFKEGRQIVAERCFFNLRYPFWHDKELTIRDCEMTQLCRTAPVSYTHLLQGCRKGKEMSRMRRGILCQKIA